jgi:tetratricopeptide (TPR) repeat protein
LRRRRHSACVVLGLVVLATVCAAHAVARTPPQGGAPKAATALPPDEAERTFTALLQRFFQAYTAKDIEGMTSLWHPNGPARSRRNVVLVEFDTRQIAMVGLTVNGASADAGGGKARAVLELAVTDTRVGKTRNERRVRDFTFFPDDTGVWRIWNEVSPAAELARQVLAAPAAERNALIAARPELASDDTINGLTTEAGRIQSQGRYEDVLDVLAVQARLARSLDNQDALGRSLANTGSIRMMTGRYPEAGEAFTAAREAYSAVANTEEVAACDANLGNLAYMQGRLTEAAERYESAYAVFEKLNDDGRMASTLHGMGNACYMQSDFSRALAYYTRALTAFRLAKDKYGEANVLQALALVHKELGDYSSAADVWRQTLALTEASGDRVGAAKAYAGLGEIYRLQGDLARALEHQLKSLALWEQQRNVGACAAARFAIGQIHALQRNFARAIESYEKALALDLSVRDDPATSESGQARELGGMAGAHFAMNQPDVALGEYERSLALREELKDEPAVMWTLAHMGVLHASQHRPEEAARAYERSLSIAEARADQNAVSTVLALRAQLELDQGRNDAALAAAARSVEIAASIEHFDTVMFAKVVIGRVHQKAGGAAGARAAYEEAVAAAAKVPVGPAAETFFDNRRAPFVALVDLFASQGNGSEAFRWSERSRLDALAEMLGGDGGIVVKGLSVEERDQERAASKDVRALNARIRRERSRQKPDAERLASLQQDLAARQSERDAVRKRIFDAHPSLRRLRAQGDPVEPDAAGALLGTGPSAIVSFVLTEDRTWAFALAKDSTTGAWDVQKVAAIEVKAADLGQQVRQFREALGKKDERAERLGRELHARLLEPLLPALAGKSRLVVVPDAFLWSVPFEALQAADGRFVVENFAVSYLPSVTALAAFAAAVPGATGPRTLLTIAQPMMAPAQEERLALLRPGSPAASAAAAAPPPRPTPDREVQAFSALFAPPARKTFVWDQATSERLGGGLAAGTLLHLAVPTVLSEAAPLYSTLAFTPSDSADPSNGLVEAYGLMFANLPAELVVASRVEYGPASGEGEALSALAWMFLVGGAPSLVLDRWMPGANDPNVAVRFARAHLATAGSARTQRPSDSLQKAMKGILAQPATRHPYYWAGYLVIGR